MSLQCLLFPLWIKTIIVKEWTSRQRLSCMSVVYLTMYVYCKGLRGPHFIGCMKYEFCPKRIVVKETDTALL